MTLSARSRRTLTRSAGAVVLTISLVAACGRGDADTRADGTPPPASEVPTPQATSAADLAVEAGLAKHVEGDLVGAAAAYNEALQLEPENVVALYNLGLLAQTQGEEADAEQRYRAVLALDPEYQPAVFNLAILRKEAGDVEAAEQLYRRAIELRPGDAGAHLNLGLLLRETGRKTEGDAQVATALKLNPEFVDPDAP